MDHVTIAGAAPAGNSAFSSRQRLIEIDDAIARIRAQIAAADLERQARGQKIDPRWFHRAKTALRHLQRERAEILIARPNAVTRKEGFKDALIAVLRERHDPQIWSAILDAAQLRAGGEDR